MLSSDSAPVGAEQGRAASPAWAAKDGPGWMDHGFNEDVSSSDCTLSQAIRDLTRSCTGRRDHVYITYQDVPLGHMAE